MFNMMENLKKNSYMIVNNKLEYHKNKSKVTVITPVYNAEKYLRRTIDSVISQSLGIENIEYILIDDCSKDGSKEILLEYSSKFSNIMVVFLKYNSGTPGKPRNIGIQLSSSKYITFLDADDWLEPTGLESLFNILEETGDDYAVGKTIQIQPNGAKIVGEHESCKERRSVSPCSISHIFQHLGPRARMCRADLLKKNQILFPEMKFAEDKQFFMDVLIHCRSMSTTTSVIYNLNRVENTNRLTNQTNIIQKTNCNLKVIRYIINKNLELDKEKMILNRLYEFDSITRFFTTPHFQKTKVKSVYYYKFRQVLRSTKSLRYDFSENFFEPFNRVVYELFRKRKYKDLAKLFEWNKKEKVKDIIIIDNLPYIVVPFLEEPYRFIRTSMFAVFQNEYILNDAYILHFKVYGDHLYSVTDAILRDSKDARIEYKFEIVIDKDGNGRLEFHLDLLQHLPASNYSIFIRYNDFMKMNIRKKDACRTIHCFQNRDYTFYQTVYSNVGLKIKG